MKHRHLMYYAALLVVSVSISFRAGAVTLGEVTLPALLQTAVPEQPQPNAAALPGDSNREGVVDLADFLTVKSDDTQAGDWKKGELSGNGLVQYEDYIILRDNYGMTYEKWSNSVVPEPLTAAGLLLAAAAALRAFRRRTRLEV